MQNKIVIILISLLMSQLTAQSNATEEETILFLESKVNNAKWLSSDFPLECKKGSLSIYVGQRSYVVDFSKNEYIKIFQIDHYTDNTTVEYCYEAKISDLSSKIRIKRLEDCDFGPVKIIISSGEGTKIKVISGKSYNYESEIRLIRKELNSTQNGKIF